MADPTRVKNFDPDPSLLWTIPIVDGIDMIKTTFILLKMTSKSISIMTWLSKFKLKGTQIDSLTFLICFDNNTYNFLGLNERSVQKFNRANFQFHV